MASQITSITIVYSAVYLGTDQRKHQSSASLAFVQGIHRWPVNSPHKGPVTRKMFPFDDVIICNLAPYHSARPLRLIRRSGISRFNLLVPDHLIRHDSRFGPCQWETALHCNDVSHWLGTRLESALFDELQGHVERRLYHTGKTSVQCSHLSSTFYAMLYIFLTLYWAVYFDEYVDGF